MSVVKQLLQQPEAFDFVQAVRVLRSLSQQDGRSIRWLSEPIPEGDPNDVTRIEHLGHEVKVHLGLESLSGCKGVIPDYLYAELLASLHQDDNALQAFLDVFNQRYFELLGHLESSASLMLRDERERSLNIAQKRLSQLGALSELLALPKKKAGGYDASVIRYGLLLAGKSRSLSGLKQLLCSYFSMDIRLQAHRSQVYRVALCDQSRIGQRLGQNNSLGHGVLLGKTGTQSFRSIEVFITPRSRKEYLALLDDHQFARAVEALMATYLRESVKVKMYLYVKRAFIDAPLLKKGQQSFRLGEANCLAPDRRPQDYRKILLQAETI